MRRFLRWIKPVAACGDRRFTDAPGCLAERKGRCPGRNLCHDCPWSPHESG